MFDGKHAKLFGCIGGIMTFFLVYGIAQERLMTTPYGEDKEKFKDTAFLVLVNRIVSIIFTLCIIVFWKGTEKEPLTPVAPIQNYAFVALSNFMATFCQYEALKYVTFPTQTLGKCAKMIPVLIIGSLLHKKQYQWKEYLAALMVMFGCTMFLTTGSVTYKKASPNDTPFGLLLIVAYLSFDGFTSTTQERVFKQYQTSTYNQLLFVNIFSAILSCFVLLLPITDTGSRLLPALSFALTHPEMLFDAVILSLCSSLGQLVIYYTIKEFGALIYSTIMTTRQFFGVLLSALLFSHALSGWQWLGAVVVFAGLWTKTMSSGSKMKKKGSDADVGKPLGRKESTASSSNESIQIEMNAIDRNSSLQ